MGHRGNQWVITERVSSEKGGEGEQSVRVAGKRQSESRSEEVKKSQAVAAGPTSICALFLSSNPTKGPLHTRRSSFGLWPCLQLGLRAFGHQGSSDDIRHCFSQSTQRFSLIAELRILHIMEGLEILLLFNHTFSRVIIIHIF